MLQATEGTGIIGLLIVCFALYEAWKINKRQTIAFSGPFRLQQRRGKPRLTCRPRAPPRARCEGCGAELAPALLACPSCRRLVHGAQALGARARGAAGDRPR